MNIKLDPADIVFSKYIRLRDRECVRCHRRGEKDRDGLPIIGLQASHYFGRKNESTRFDPENVDSLCFGCHQYWGSQNREAYRNFKKKRLGEQRFAMLVIRANTLEKKDRKMQFIFWSEVLRRRIKSISSLNRRVQ